MASSSTRFKPGASGPKDPFNDLVQEANEKILSLQENIKIKQDMVAKNKPVGKHEFFIQNDFQQLSFTVKKLVKIKDQYVL